MTTLYWQPINDANLLRRQIDRVFDEAADALTKGSGSRSSTADGLRRYWHPAVELVDTPEAFQLRALLPAVTHDSLDIQATRHAVMIAGVRPAPELGEQQQMLRSELAYGAFQRIVDLPAEIHSDKVEADFQNGLLTVTLPKADLQHKIKVRVGALAGADAQKSLEGSQRKVACA